MERRPQPEQYHPVHPFRSRIVRRTGQTRPVRSDDSDLKLFALSFTAFFICIYTFLL